MLKLKITSVNICKLIHDVIIILVLNDPLRLEDAERKKKKLQTFEYLQDGKSFLDEIKSIFHNF